MTYEAGRELDAFVAEARGLNVVARDWPCGLEPDSCEMEAYPYPEQDAPEHYAPHPIYVPENGRWPAERVYGHLYVRVEPVPFYSTDIAAAWALIDALEAGRSRDFVRVISVTTLYPGYVEVTIETEPVPRIPSETPWHEMDLVWGDTAPHAICLAFLRIHGRYPNPEEAL